MNELQVKVRPYRIEYAESEFEKVETSTVPDVNAVFNRDVFLSLDAYAELKGIISGFRGHFITRQTMANEEYSIMDFFKGCFSRQTASFEEPQEEHFQIYGDKYFEYY